MIVSVQIQTPDRYGPRQRHTKALDVARRGLALVENHTNDQADAIYEQPTSRYLDPARFPAAHS